MAKTGLGADDCVLVLTPGQARELGEQIADLLEQWKIPHAAHPQGRREARQVAFICQGFPLDPVIAMTARRHQRHHGLWSLQATRHGSRPTPPPPRGSPCGCSILAGYLVSGSTAKAGWVGTACLVCQQVAAVFGGTFIDRHDRRRLIIINAVCGAAAWGSVGLLMALGRMTYLLFLVICAAASGVSGFLSGATDALLRSIVPISDYPQARSLNEGRDAAISMAGGPVSGFLYALAPFVPFAASALLYALSGASACLLPRAPRSADESEENQSLIDRQSAGHPHPNRDSGQEVTNTSGSGQSALANSDRSQKSPSFWHDLAEGWRWVFTRPLLVLILLCMMLLNFSVNGIGTPSSSRHQPEGLLAAHRIS